jgi:hypothetical protein
VKLGFEVLDHPAYSPDLVPSDYHLFGPLQDASRGRRFTSDEEVKGAVHEWLGTSVLKSTGTMLKIYNFKVSAVVEINYKNCVRILIDLPSYVQLKFWSSF